MTAGEAGTAGQGPGEGDLASMMSAVASVTEAELDRLLAPGPDIPRHLLEAMRYAALGGGKRLRPFLVHAAAGLGEADLAARARVGAAIELVHAYSLVHDDLPAMDDALLRRGRPACHKAFGEAAAILAGDALVALAFEALARPDWPATDGTRTRLVAGLARASGAAGMCGGQMLDLSSAASGPHLTNEADLVRLQQMKTGALIRFALDAGCVLGGLNPPARKALAAYGDALGLAFQIRDDMLDVTGRPEETGKDGRDQALARATFVSLLGLDGAESHLHALAEAAATGLAAAGLRSPLLLDLFAFVTTRRA